MPESIDDTTVPIAAASKLDESSSSRQSPAPEFAHSFTAGVGALLDANLNEASIQVSALQVQQQLWVQALAIANANAQKILKLVED